MHNVEGRNSILCLFYPPIGLAGLEESTAGNLMHLSIKYELYKSCNGMFCLNQVAAPNVATQWKWNSWSWQKITKTIQAKTPHGEVITIRKNTRKPSVLYMAQTHHLIVVNKLVDATELVDQQSPQHFHGGLRLEGSIVVLVQGVSFSIILRWTKHWRSKFWCFCY